MCSSWSFEGFGMRPSDDGRSWWRRWLLRGQLVLAGAATRALAGDDDSLDEELSTPHAPWLAALESTNEAERAHRAVDAQGLGVLHIARRLGEPELRVVHPARQARLVHLAGLVVEVAQSRLVGGADAVENADGHVFHLLCSP